MMGYAEIEANNGVNMNWTLMHNREDTLLANEYGLTDNLKFMLGFLLSHSSPSLPIPPSSILYYHIAELIFRLLYLVPVFCESHHHPSFPYLIRH